MLDLLATVTLAKRSFATQPNVRHIYTSMILGEILSVNGALFQGHIVFAALFGGSPSPRRTDSVLFWVLLLVSLERNTQGCLSSNNFGTSSHP